MNGNTKLMYEEAIECVICAVNCGVPYASKRHGVSESTVRRYMKRLRRPARGQEAYATMKQGFVPVRSEWSES